MNQKRAIQCFIIVVLLSMLLLASCGQSARKMTIVQLEGQPEIMQKGSSDWKPIVPGVQFNPGDSVRTKDGEYIWMAINDGSVFGVGKNSEAKLLTLSSSMTDPVTLIDLSEGMAFVTVTKSLGKGSFEVQTPIITAGVVGSKMAVDYDKTKSSAQIACLEGTVKGKYGDDTDSPQVDSDYILGVSIGTHTGEFNTEMNRIRSTDEVYNEFNYFDSRYVSNYSKTVDPLYTATSLTKTALALEKTRQASITPSVTPTGTSTPTATITNTPYGVFPTATLRFTLMPTLAYNPDEGLSAAELANSGTHTYQKTASYSGACTGPASANETLTITFEKGTMSIAGSLTLSKVGPDTYQAENDGDSLTVVLNSGGFSASGSCVEWVFTQ